MPINKTIQFEKDPATEEPIAVLEGRFTMTDLVNLLSSMEKGTGTAPEGVKVGGMEVISLVSAQTGQPIVELQSQHLDRPLQFDHQQALGFAEAIIQSVASAISDSVTASYFMNELRLSRKEVAALLYSMRQYRDQLFGINDRKDS